MPRGRAPQTELRAHAPDKRLGSNPVAVHGIVVRAGETHHARAAFLQPRKHSRTRALSYAVLLIGGRPLSLPFGQLCSKLPRLITFLLSIAFGADVASAAGAVGLPLRLERLFLHAIAPTVDVSSHLCGSQSFTAPSC